MGDKITRAECEAVGGEFESGKCLVENEDRFEGRFNSTRMGRVWEDPPGLMIVGDDVGPEEPVAKDRVSKTALESAVSRTRGVTIGEMTDYLLEEKPKVKVFTVEDGEVEKTRYSSYKRVAWSEFGTLTGKVFK